MPNYATKIDFKKQQELIDLILAAESDLACLEPEIHKIDIGKLKTGPADLSKLSNKVKKKYAKKKLCMINWLQK